jgi:hypothetical protein
MNSDIIDITELKIGDIYKNTIQTIIDIINDIIIYMNNTSPNKTKSIFNDLFNIFFSNDRMFYIGVVLIILSFVIYFIDGVSI